MSTTQRRVVDGQCCLFLGILNRLLNLGRYRTRRRRTLSLSIGKIVSNEHGRRRLSKLPTIKCSRSGTMFGHSLFGIPYYRRCMVRLVRHCRCGGVMVGISMPTGKEWFSRNGTDKDRSVSHFMLWSSIRPCLIMIIRYLDSTRFLAIKDI